MRRVVIGSDCVLGTESAVTAGAVLGANVHVAPRGQARGRVPAGALVFGGQVIPRDSPKWRSVPRCGMQMPGSDSLAVSQLVLTLLLATQIGSTLLFAIVGVHEVNERFLKFEEDWKVMTLLPLGWYPCIQRILGLGTLPSLLHHTQHTP